VTNHAIDLAVLEALNVRFFVRAAFDQYGPNFCNAASRQPRTSTSISSISCGTSADRSVSIHNLAPLRELDREIAQLEAAGESLLRDGLPEDDREPEQRDYSHSYFSGGSPDRSFER